jgi:lipopolysaccharide transport system ATP-binding protein
VTVVSGGPASGGPSSLGTTRGGEPPAIIARGLGKRYRLVRPRDRLAGADDGIGASAEASTPGEKGAWVWALRHVDLELPRGEILGIIGRNGSGKTTLLKILAGVTTPTAGMAEVRGRVAALLQVGAGFHPQLTGRDNVALSGAIMGLSAQEIRDQFEAIVEFAEIGQRYLDEPVKHYSSGMYARLAFSVAAFLPAEILLIDEILAVGDAAFSQKAREHMTRLLRDGRSVIYVGHDLDVIRSLCQQALVLDRGRVAFAGEPGSAIEHYQRGVGVAAPGARSDRPPAAAEAR